MKNYLKEICENSSGKFINQNENDNFDLFENELKEGSKLNKQQPLQRSMFNGNLEISQHIKIPISCFKRFYSY